MEISIFNKFIISPLGNTTSKPKHRSLVLPYFKTFIPPAFVAIFPPIKQLPEDERVLSIKELDEGQVMHKPGKL